MNKITTTISSKPRDWLMIGALGLTWGTAFIFIEIALKGITPFWLATARITLAAIATNALWYFRGARLFATTPNRQVRVHLVTISILSSALPFMLISWGQQHVTAGFAGISMAAVALAVLPMAHFMVPGEALNLRKSIGFLVGFAGVAVLIGVQIFGKTGAPLEMAGRFACLAAACCYAYSSVRVRLLPAVDTLGLSAVTLSIGAIFVSLVAIGLEGPPPIPNTKTLGALVFLGLIPTAAANLLRMSVIRSAGPTFMSLTNYQVPMWSVLLGALILSEPLPLRLLVALVLILCGVAISQWHALSKLISRET